jgi:hypothetical protein
MGCGDLLPELEVYKSKENLQKKRNMNIIITECHSPLLLHNG